eukprot:CAMPEP_0197188464 /NCGR_PEP_ID=MMETSP1423-20130617/17838_1 /TAXON_ID=476441 /ORGANISM="Pseudo-nitzschia heimii, Strain UNC1101" /LENGTH=230 /DNA_ID=CAMNT_0042640299 /DNA_START=68 /DNA_END=760 /DNA_ORIENTATION=+
MISSTATESTTTTTTTTFESYVAFAARALQKSRKSLDSHALIQLAYGDDTTHIGGNVMLIGILDSVLDKISTEMVLEQLKHYGSSTISVPESMGIEHRRAISEKNTHGELATPQEILDKIDQVISYVINWEEERDRIESFDARSARECLNQNQLPKSMTTKDFIAYREHKQRRQAKTALRQELQRIEEETLALRKESEEKEATIRKQIREITKVGRELEVSANVFAMISI